MLERCILKCKYFWCQLVFGQYAFLLLFACGSCLLVSEDSVSFSPGLSFCSSFECQLQEMLCSSCLGECRLLFSVTFYEHLCYLIQYQLYTVFRIGVLLNVLAQWISISFTISCLNHFSPSRAAI